MHVINLFSSWQHNRFVNYTKDIREIWKHCSLTLFSARYWEEEERGNRCKCNSISHGYSVRIVLIFHRWNSINWNARNQAASANFFFFFFQILAIYRLERRSVLHSPGLNLRRQELRADVTLKMNFRVQCSQLWWDARDFFFSLSRIVSGVSCCW